MILETSWRGNSVVCFGGRLTMRQQLRNSFQEINAENL